MSLVAGIRVLLVVALTGVLIRAAEATQYLVSPAENWSALSDKLKPGDEVILMPGGQHRPAVLENLSGEPKRPIVIHGLDAKNPPIIAAEAHGLVLRNARHVLVENIAIDNAKISGVVIEADEKIDSSLLGPVRLRNITITRTAHATNRNAVAITNMRDVAVNKCEIRGFGGAGVAIDGCRDVTIESSTIAGGDAAGAHGIVVRGGSSNVTISRCIVRGYAEAGITLGTPRQAGTSEHSVQTPEEKPPSARIVKLRRCLLEGGQYGVALLGAADCTFRYNTVIDPAEAAVFVGGSSNPTLQPTTNCNVGENIFLWLRNRPTAFVAHDNTLEHPDPQCVLWEPNLWWMDDSEPGPIQPETWPGSLLAEQITDTNPQLSTAYVPRSAQAKRYGAASP